MFKMMGGAEGVSQAQGDWRGCRGVSHVQGELKGVAGGV